MSNYKEEKDMKKKIRANEIIVIELPPFCKSFFEVRRDLTGSSRMAYCYTLLEFFSYLKDNNSFFNRKEIYDFTLDDLNNLSKADMEEFFTWKETHVKYKDTSAKPASLKRTKSLLSTFWTYYVQENKLDINPLVGIRLEKLEKKDPVALNRDEKSRLLDTIKYGSGLTGATCIYHDQSKERDYAITYLFLHTGIRIEELVGIDVTDIDFFTHSVYIRRKGHKSQEVYFSDAAELALQEYLAVRNTKYKPYTSNALFLNKYGERITERSIERMLKKYVKIALPSRKNITPHKLRSTYACDMLEKTDGDIELVSQQLGHANLSTTQIYAKSGKQKRAMVRNILD